MILQLLTLLQYFWEKESIIKSDPFYTGRAGEAWVQFHRGGRDRWGRWGRRGTRGKKWTKTVEDTEQSAADSHTAGKEPPDVPKGETSWMSSWRCVCVKCIIWKGAKPNSVISFDNYLKEQRIKIKTAVMKINSITAWRPNKASSVPTTDYKGETWSSNWAVFLITLDLTGFLEMFPQLSWSYSKYMAALKREEVLLRRQSQLEASFSTASGTHTHTHTHPSICLPGLLTTRCY